jgi:hypothetical protein
MAKTARDSFGRARQPEAPTSPRRRNVKARLLDLPLTRWLYRFCSRRTQLGRARCHRARQLDPTKRSARAVRDQALKAIIQRVWREQDQASDPERSGSRWAEKGSTRRAAACGA